MPFNILRFYWIINTLSTISILSVQFFVHLRTHFYNTSNVKVIESTYLNIHLFSIQPTTKYIHTHELTFLLKLIEIELTQRLIRTESETSWKACRTSLVGRQKSETSVRGLSRSQDRLEQAPVGWCKHLPYCLSIHQWCHKKSLNCSCAIIKHCYIHKHWFVIVSIYDYKQVNFRSASKCQK